MASPAAPADRIYVGGPILTVEDDRPTVEALAVTGGVIVRLGSVAEVEALRGPGTEMVDLEGRTLVPGFIDGHAHVNGFGAQAVGATLLASPDGNANTIDDLVEALREFAAGPDVGRTGWVFGMGYDDSLLGRHPESRRPRPRLHRACR